MTTYNELFLDAITNGFERMAYSVCWFIRNGKSGNDIADTVDWNSVDHDEVTAMIERNELDIKQVKVYSAPLGNNEHIIVFDKDEMSAKNHIYKEKNRIVNKVFDLTDKIDKSFWFPEDNTYKSLFDLKNDSLTFPSTAMIFEKRRWNV